MLGAWHGMKGEAKIQWNTILETQASIMNTWSKARPSLKGRVLLLKSLICSRALYLSMVNGMPNAIKDQMEKQNRHFLWNNKKGLIDWDTAIAPIHDGGLDAPSIKSRLLAIETMWLKRLRHLHPKPQHGPYSLEN